MEENEDFSCQWCISMPRVEQILLPELECLVLVYHPPDKIGQRSPPCGENYSLICFIESLSGPPRPLTDLTSGGYDVEGWPGKRRLIGWPLNHVFFDGSITRFISEADYQI